MASKSIFIAVASVLLIQVVYGQCGCGSGLNLANGLGYGGYGGLGYGELGYGGLGYGGLNNGIELTGASGSAGVLAVSSGSATTPNGLSLLSENLELAGQLEVSGAYPFVTAVGINGALPSGGGATVSYSSAPGVGISSAGCGAGLSGASIAGTGLRNSGSYGLSGYNNIGGNYAGRSGRCGCGY